jgi:hypothetical protein
MKGQTRSVKVKNVIFNGREGVYQDHMRLSRGTISYYELWAKN